MTGFGLLPGCGCYYSHLAWGQARLVAARRPVRELLEDERTPAELRRRLALVEETREFAAWLGLAVGRQYTSYVPWPGDRVITVLVASEPGSIEAVPFRFPIVGSAPYKGFFDLERAQREAASLQRRGMDVCLVPVSAYSTLGWLNDPITGPMLRYDDGELVEILLHELVHATVFVKSQPEFNEGLANFVGQEASVSFFAAREVERPATAAPPLSSGPEPTANPPELSPSAGRRARVRDDRLLADALAQIREQIRELYARDLPDERRAALRSTLETGARQELAGLTFETLDAAVVAGSIRLNDACLALTATYTSDTDRYTRALERLGGDLGTFIEHFKRAARADDPRAAFFSELIDSPREP